MSVITLHSEHIYLCKILAQCNSEAVLLGFVQHGSLNTQDQSNNGRQGGDENEAEHTILTPKIRRIKHAESLKILFEVTESINNGKKS